MLPKTFYGAIDLGSRNCRLLIVEHINKKIIPLEVQSRIVDLGEGINRTHRLSKKAIERSLNVLHQYKKRLSSYYKIAFQCVTTEACRRAVNQKSFIKRIEYETGLQFNVIDFKQEALYALKGCQPLISEKTDYALLFDIGGASTELIWARCKNGNVHYIIDCISIPCGVITISELFTTNLLKNYQETSRTVYESARDFRNKNNIRELSSYHTIQLIGTSGTTTTIAALHLNLRFYDSQKVDKVVLTFDDVQDVIKKIQLMSPHERIVHPCIGSNREDLILGGVAIFDGLYRAWPELSVLVTDRGVRDGIVAELIETHQVKPYS